MLEKTIYSVVHQTIPNECMRPIERWCLTRQFSSEVESCGLRLWSKRFENESCIVDLVHCDGHGELARAIAASERDAPELCESLKSAMSTGKVRPRHFQKIFSRIVKRHRDVLPFISVECSWTDTSFDCSSFGGAILLILPDKVESINTVDWLESTLSAHGFELPYCYGNNNEYVDCFKKCNWLNDVS
jgi:hypothetical protein